MKRSDSSRTIFVALAANVLIAIAKLAAGMASGSTAMLAESAHSFADSLNEVLLGISLRRAVRPADSTHPLGHGRERFLWALLAAIASFLIGGCLSVGLAIRQLALGGEVSHGMVPWAVLAVAFVADGISWLQSMRQARREARERGRDVWRHLLRSSDPIVRAIVVEDSAALVGILIAAGGLLVTHFTGDPRADAVAAILIGLLLGLTAFGLARPLADFLVGRSLPPEMLEELREIIAASPAIERVLYLQAVYTGPEEVVVAAKVHPHAGLEIEELARAMDEIDHALREGSPFVADVYLDVTAKRVMSDE